MFDLRTIRADKGVVPYQHGDYMSAEYKAAWVAG